MFYGGYEGFFFVELAVEFKDDASMLLPHLLRQLLRHLLHLPLLLTLIFLLSLIILHLDDAYLHLLIFLLYLRLSNFVFF
jgi:hypothetical protein